jgi:hypothetical protein
MGLGLLYTIRLTIYGATKLVLLTLPRIIFPMSREGVLKNVSPSKHEHCIFSKCLVL